MKPEEVRPISAPLLAPLEEEEVPESFPSEEGRQAEALDAWARERQEAAKFMPEHVASQPVAVVQLQSVMTISNRFNYNHYYKIPAYVGMNNMPQLVQVMQSEGCKLGDIQITFEVKEIK